MTQQNRLITLDAAQALATKAKVPACSKRWWKRRIAEGRIQSQEGVVTYVYETEVLAIICLVREAMEWERGFGESYIDVGEDVIRQRADDKRGSDAA
jgi:hypothetical protein